MAENKEKLIVVMYNDKHTCTNVYRAAIQVEFRLSTIEANRIPNEFIAGTIANELRRLAINFDETEIQKRVHHAKGHPVCPCCHREIVFEDMEGE